MLHCVYCQAANPKKACGNFCGAVYCNTKCARVHWQIHQLECIFGRVYDSNDVVAHLTQYSDDNEYLDNYIDDIYRFDKWTRKEIPIKDLNWDPLNVSKKSSKSTIEYYKTLSTKQPPIIVIPDVYGTTGKKYRILDGYHRVAVMVSRGRKTITAFVPKI